MRIAINCDKYREELADDRKVATHLIMQDFFVTNNTMKIKLINEVQKTMNVSPLCIDDINKNVEMPDNKREVIKKVFKLTDVNLISMYRNIVPHLVKSKSNG